MLILDPDDATRYNGVVQTAADPLLAWASEEFYRPWERLCRVAHRLSLGAELSPEEARVRLLFTSLKIDYAAVYPLVGALLRTALFQPARLATVVHDGRGRVVRAYHEDTRDGHYVALRPLELPEVVSLDGPNLLPLANRRVEAQGLPRVDWVKIADLRFFETFRAAGADPRELFAAVRTVVEKGWIAFHPLPPAFRALFRWMERLREFDPRQLKIPSLPIPETAVAVRGPDFTTILHSRRLAVRSSDDGPFPGLARRLVEQGLAPQVLAVRAEPLLHFVREWLLRERWDFYFASEHLKAAGAFAKRLGESWDLAPRPRGVSRFMLWLSRWLFLPLDVDSVLQRGVAAVLREVVAEKGESRLGLVVDEKRTLAAIDFRFRDGAVEEVRTHPPERFDNCVDPPAAFGYKPAIPAVAVHLDAMREWLRFGEASWGERIRIAARSTVSLYPESLARRIPRRRRWWLWQVLRLPFLRR